MFDSQKIPGHGHHGGPQGDGMSSISSGGSEEDTCANSDSASTNDTNTVASYKIGETNHSGIQTRGEHSALQVRFKFKFWLNL